MKICPTCKAECEDFCMCGKCPSCSPDHFAPPKSSYDPRKDTDTLQYEIHTIAANVAKGEL